jgi:outer membrane protein assembly factor BamB
MGSRLSRDRSLSRRKRSVLVWSSLLAASLLVLPMRSALADTSAAPPPPPIPSPPADGSAPYIGAPATANPLPQKTQYAPLQSLMHADGGNTNTSNFPGPLGNSPIVNSAAVGSLAPFMWDFANRLTTGCAVRVAGVTQFCVAAVDPHTLTVEARWFPPDSGQSLQFAYMAMTADDRILAISRQGHVYVVQRSDGGTGPSFTTLRDIDLLGQGVVGTGDILLAAMFDAAGNIWFTTGGILGIGDQPKPHTTMGYIDPVGGVHSMEIKDQVVENGIAMDANTMYMVTGPPSSVTTDAVGYMDAFTAGPHGSIQTLWQQAYDAGSITAPATVTGKPGGFARGSGSTPTLLGHNYVAITDNADNQIHLNVYRLNGNPNDANRQVCSLPLFTPGFSANDIGTIGFRDGGGYGVVALNDFNAPPISASYDMRGMSPGVERVNVSSTGTCSVAWDNLSVRIKSVPFLSTATGLIYGYTQDPTLAAQGQYDWYVIALDAKTGNVVWEIRTGSGVIYNDSYEPGSLGPDGTFYQTLPVGVVSVKDGS